MVGRGIVGKPWLISQISAYLNKETQPEIPKGQKLIEIVAVHYDDILSFYGNNLGKGSPKTSKTIFRIFWFAKETIK